LRSEPVGSASTRIGEKSEPPPLALCHATTRPSFPGAFLYYPGRRQRPACLTAFVAVVKEWRKQPRA